MNQRTITREVTFSGSGLHSGRQASVRLHPAPPNEGLVFFRDGTKTHRIPALWRHVVDTSLATTLECEGTRVRTVEHFLAATFAFGINNLHIVMDEEEMPILDGCCETYGNILADAGITEQSETQASLVVVHPIHVETGIKRLTVTPADQLSFTYHLSIPEFGEQNCLYIFSEKSFLREIGRARTFATANDLLTMRTKGLAQGIGESPGFVLVPREFAMDRLRPIFGAQPLEPHFHTVPSGSVLSREKPRFADEAVRHKILDMVGDMILAGHPVVGRFEAYGTGHSENVRLLRKLMATPEAWTLQSFE